MAKKLPDVHFLSKLIVKVIWVNLLTKLWPTMEPAPLPIRSHKITSCQLSMPGLSGLTTMFVSTSLACFHCQMFETHSIAKVTSGDDALGEGTDPIMYILPQFFGNPF
jgi:hypothetical protein